MCQIRKKEIRKEKFYDSSKGKALLIEWVGEEKEGAAVDSGVTDTQHAPFRRTRLVSGPHLEGPYEVISGNDVSKKREVDFTRDLGFSVGVD